MACPDGFLYVSPARWLVLTAFFRVVSVLYFALARWLVLTAFIRVVSVLYFAVAGRWFVAMCMCRCDGPDVAHVPRQRSACDKGRIYFLFKACEDGCLSCVRELVEEEGLDPRQLSLSRKYTAMDFAEWGQSYSSCPDKYDDVIAYLNV